MTPHARMATAVAFAAALAAAPVFAHRGPPPTPICIDLANNPTWGLAGNPAISGLTAVITPATATNAAHCQVDFTDVSLEGRFWGYMHGQTSKYRIRVGLPLNTNDGGTSYMWQLEDVTVEDTMVTQFTTQEDADGWGCQHALSPVSNVIVEAWACSYRVGKEAVAIATDMVANAKK